LDPPATDLVLTDLGTTPELPEVLLQPATSDLPLVWRPHAGEHPGLCDYQTAVHWMETLVARPADCPDVLLAVEHPPVATLGRRGGREYLLGTHWHHPDGTDVELQVHEVGRGGKITMHAPGQLVVYPIVQLPKLAGPIGGKPLGDLPLLVRHLEHAIIETCRAFGLLTVRKEGFPGVWTGDQRKIASVGLGVRHGWSFHGLGFNVCPHLDLFSLMVPCGLDGAQLTSLWRELDELGLPRPPMAEVRERLLQELAAGLRRNPTLAPDRRSGNAVDR
jgi:lipoyl(octanoyl) transferase